MEDMQDYLIIAQGIMKTARDIVEDVTIKPPRE